LIEAMDLNDVQTAHELVHVNIREHKFLCFTSHYNGKPDNTIFLISLFYLIYEVDVK